MKFTVKCECGWSSVVYGSAQAGGDQIKREAVQHQASREHQLWRDDVRLDEDRELPPDNANHARGRIR